MRRLEAGRAAPLGPETARAGRPRTPALWLGSRRRAAFRGFGTESPLRRSSGPGSVARGCGSPGGSGRGGFLPGPAVAGQAGVPLRPVRGAVRMNSLSGLSDQPVGFGGAHYGPVVPRRLFQHMKHYMPFSCPCGPSLRIVLCRGSGVFALSLKPGILGVFGLCSFSFGKSSGQSLRVGGIAVRRPGP